MTWLLYYLTLWSAANRFPPFRKTIAMLADPAQAPFVFVRKRQLHAGCATKNRPTCSTNGRKHMEKQAEGVPTMDSTLPVLTKSRCLPTLPKHHLLLFVYL